MECISVAYAVSARCLSVCLLSRVFCRNK